MANMKIVAYSDETFSSQVGEYEFMLNPDKMQWGRSIQYNQETALAGEASIKYSKTAAETLSFEVVLDCTGVVDSKRLDLPTEMAQLSKVSYDYNGSIHRPNYLIINWGGGLAFRCVLTSMSTSYTFFKPDGTPLRARLSLAFSSYTDLKTLARKENKQSPDMTHRISVIEGDSLPQISQRIYQTPAYTVQLAKFNGLNKFRQLQAGRSLIAPPLISQGE